MKGVVVEGSGIKTDRSVFAVGLTNPNKVYESAPGNLAGTIQAIESGTATPVDQYKVDA